MSLLISLPVKGADAATFLQGYVTNNLEVLQPKLGQPMALTEIKGRVIANGWCFGRPDNVTLVFHQSVLGTVKNHLGRYLAFAKSKLIEPAVTLNLTAKTSTNEIELAPFGWGIESAGKAESHLNRLTVDQQFPIVQAATSGLFLPQMLNLTQFDCVSFTKGCYLGQEIVARAEHLGEVKRKLFRTTVSTTTAAVGSSLNLIGRGKCTVVGVDHDRALLVGRLSSTADSPNTHH